MANINFEYHNNPTATEVIVFTPGSGDGIERYRPLLDLVKDDYSYLVFDGPGVGKSEARKIFTAKVLAKEYLEIIEQLGIEKFHLWGSSFGAFTALELIDLKQHAVTSFISVCGGVGAFMQDRIAKSQMTQCDIIAAGEFSAESKFKAFGMIFNEENENHETLTKEWIARNSLLAKGVNYSFASASYRHAFFARLATIKVPTLLIHGTKDFVVDFENALIMLKMLPNARLLAVKCGHYPDKEVVSVPQHMLDFTKGKAVGVKDYNYQLDIELLTQQEKMFLQATSDYDRYEEVIKTMFARPDIDFDIRLNAFKDVISGK